MFIYYQVVYLCCISFCFVAWQDIYFVFAHNLARIFISKKNFQIPLRIKWPSPKRYIGGSRGGQVPLFVLGYRLVKTYFNRIFPVSSLSFFFLPCLVILNYVSVSFDISKKKKFWKKNGPPLWKCLDLPLRYMYIVVQCGWIRYNDLCCRLCKIFCFMPSCSLGGSTYPQKNKAGHSPYNVSFLFYETWFCCLTIFIRLEDSHYFLLRMLFYDMNQVYMIVGP